MELVPETETVVVVVFVVLAQKGLLDVQMHSDVFKWPLNVMR